MTNSKAFFFVTKAVCLFVFASGCRGGDDEADDGCRMGSSLACSDATPCPGNMVCFYSTVPEEATCATPCSSDVDCPGSLSCDREFAVCTAACSTDLSTPGSTFAGYWQGTLDGREISFHIDEAGVLDSMIAIVRMDLGAPGACTGPFVLDEPVPVLGAAFSADISFVAGSPATTISGQFSSATSASGALAPYSASAYTLACGSSFITGSSSGAFRIVDAASWSAAPTTGSCKYENDGECDESAGTGVCLEGTDTADCGG